VLLVSVRDLKLESDFGFKNRPTEFIDLETGERLKLNPSEIRELYKNRQEDFFKELEILCGQFSIDYLNADIKKEFGSVLQSYLLKRKKLM
jgi:hypothetical protein